MSFQPLLARDVRWAPVSGAGLEHLHLTTTPDGVVARSVVIGERGGRPYGVSYELRLDAEWHVQSFDIRAAHGDRLALTQSAPGFWIGSDGTERADLAGCIDIDLAGTPFTNTLPIRRLGERLTEPTELRMLYVPFDTFEPVVDEQRYTEISERLFRYEAVDRSFAAELPVDEDGLVLDYPTLFKRL
ncbi:transcriptional regulator [Aureimonas ureilytica]|uniref:Transcriptional regulator n=1 Tax=Aureimonas ureilytica TaxID=401562 RepID=A0A175RQ19_9HYPH|nr:putative glycolipid-binding domain-containing protein [Aureimonas ureilytica]KTR05064.1 transcriptional regulator [Aureimonas ureilytica]